MIDIIIRPNLAIRIMALFALLSYNSPVNADTSDGQKALDAFTAGDYQQAKRLWRGMAEAGDVDGQSNLAGLLLSPLDGEQNIEEALYWFEKAAQGGNAPAALSLGHMYRTGVGGVLEPNTGKAMEWYGAAAKLGNVEAGFFDAVLGLQSANTSQGDIPQLVKSVHDAAQNGFVPAIHEVATYLHNGRYVQRDVPRAVQWYEQAADAGFVESQYVLANIHMNAEMGSTDLQKAAERFEQAASRGHTRSQFALGYLILQGGVENVEPREALPYFEKAAEGWDVLAQVQLGAMYLHGTATQKDPFEAYKWFDLAASGGSTEAHFLRAVAASRLSDASVEAAHAAAQKWFDENHQNPHGHDTLAPHAH